LLLTYYYLFGIHMEHHDHHTSAIEEHEEQPQEETAHRAHKRRWPHVNKLFNLDWKNALVGFACGILALNILSLLFTVDVSIQPKWKNARQASTAKPANDVSQSAGIEAELAAAVLPQEGAVIPVQWGDLGKKLIETGVLDDKKFAELYAQRGGVPQDIQNMLSRTDQKNIRITAENSGALLNILWALGIGSKNVILDKGPMSDPQYGGAAGFASTGGWTIAKGDAMEHYSKHEYFSLTKEQQARVESVSQNIYRPCCGNSTYFPDCNHGMAMLGLLELMASQNMSEDDMYRVALQVNAYWFPDTYMTVAKYLKKRGTEWNAVNPKEVLGAAFSSAQGYKNILSEEQPVQQKGGGGGCGV
jgi:hypothetical protein